MDAFLLEPVVTLALRTFLALLFLTAAWSKLSHAEEFYGVVRNFRLLPDAASRIVARGLPVLEVLVAVGLVVRPFTALAATLAAMLLLIFAVALGINVLRGRTWIDCGCLRQGMKQPVSGWLVARNLGLAALALAVAAVLPGVGEASVIDITTGLMAGATAMLIYLGASLLGGLAALQSTTPSTKGR